ncbi:hypothetical protein [Halobacterium sp. KA-6]|uniref:hypothetical protein n=1 Tax=Halobacterium sp. KA-6 TaxID=2896368 RepID=UPI001E4F75B3|nr:hypothetical protein [Halobacterium sp. KA-6]MCD2204379.1 hypothetical protein [Halobacterium sp. KA-6]
MSATYQPGIQSSHHLSEERWPGRATLTRDVDPETAWYRAHPLDIPQGYTTGAYPRLPEHDEARIDPDTRTVLFRRSSVLVTCFDLDRVDTFHGHAVRAAVRDQYPEVLHE